MTAYEFLNEHNTINHFYSDKEGKMICYSEDVEKAMKAFAKYHVQEALKEASKQVDFTDETYIAEGSIIEIDTNSILKAYPLNQIK